MRIVQNNLIKIVFLSFLLVIYPIWGSCQLSVDTQRRFYMIEGNTAEEIRENLDTNRSAATEGISFDAYTHWYITWNYKFLQSPGSCTIDAVATHIAVEQILPQLITPVADELQDRWNRYIEALQHHENGHKNIGIQAAEKINRLLEQLNPKTNCAALEQTVNQTAEDILRQYNLIEKKYDKETQHGAKTGAVFP